MPISITRYIDITSSVGAGIAVSTRALNARFYTENPLVPTHSFVSFNSAAEVAEFFGSSSTEYARALFYFSWVSKINTSPSEISFARWAESAVASTIYGRVGNYAVSQFTPVTTGDLTLTLDGYTSHITGINLSGAGSLAAVASAMQTAIRAITAGGTAWTAATVTYDATRKSFNLVSGDTGNGSVAVVAGSVTDVASKLGWLTGAILSDGSDAQSITDLLEESAASNNNFGSFGFVPDLTIDETIEAATWNQAQNNMFMYCSPVSEANAVAWNAALIDIDGTSLTLSKTVGQYPEQAPMMILAATDYTRPNSTQNYMFQQFDLTPSITSNAGANTYDPLRINYYGQTQTAGQNLSFYQRGVMMGGASSPIDMNVYANEIWLKDAMGAALMTLLIASTKISANLSGKSQILAIVQDVINQAISNGTISVGKPLNAQQKQYITTITNDPLAWQQVSNSGFWVDVQIVSFVEDSVVRYKAIYTLVYSKDDIIRKIEGSNILI